MHKANIVAFIKTNFLRPVLTLANTPFMFFAFFVSFSSPNVSFFLFIYSQGVCTTLRKILDILDEKQQRNNLSKLGTLKYEFPQHLHSALACISLSFIIFSHYSSDDEQDGFYYILLHIVATSVFVIFACYSSEDEFVLCLLGCLFFGFYCWILLHP